jgi:GNAT superfamily N-acetyltransferase
MSGTVLSPALLPIRSHLRRPQTLTFDVEDDTAEFVARLDDVVELYCSVFNGIAGIKPRWTLGQVAQLMRERAQQPAPIRVVLTDRGCVVGAVVAALTPKADGIWVTDVDLLLLADYRRRGLGRKLYEVARQCAARKSLSTFGESPVMIEFSTYRQLDFPKSWWLSLGYRPFPLFSADVARVAMKDVRERVNIRNLEPADVDAVSTFMARRDVHDLNGWVWSKSRAAVFLAFTVRNRASVVLVAEIGDRIVALITGDLAMRRGGPSVTHITYVRRNTFTLTAMMVERLVQSANRLSLQTYESGVVDLELTKTQAWRLKPLLAEVREDHDFIGMSIAFESLIESAGSRLSSS